MPIYARCSRCGRRVAPGTLCICTTKSRKESYALYDRHSRDKRADEFYHSAEWKQIRDYVMERDNGIDQYLYQTCGKVQAADTVHHIVPLKESWSRRCDPDNLIALSSSSHNEIESVYKTAEKGQMQEKLFDILAEKRGRG